MKLRAAYERPLILAALPLVLAACRATNSIEPPSTATPPLAAARWLPANEACGEATVDALDRLGGTQRVAHIPDRRTLYGEFGLWEFRREKAREVVYLELSVPTIRSPPFHRVILQTGSEAGGSSALTYAVA